MTLLGYAQLFAYVAGGLAGLTTFFILGLPLLGKTPGRMQRALREVLGFDDALSMQTAQLKDTITVNQRASTDAVHELTGVVTGNHQEALGALQRHEDDPFAHGGVRR